MDYLVIYWAIVSFILLIMMRIDKNRAIRHQYRISERTLWLVALAGGAFGGTVGMYVFRHKTKHLTFKWGFPLLSLLQIVAMVNVA